MVITNALQASHRALQHLVDTAPEEELTDPERGRRTQQQQAKRRLAELRWDRDVPPGTCHLYDQHARRHQGACPNPAPKTGKHVGVCRSHQALLADNDADVLDIKVLPRRAS